MRWARSNEGKKFAVRGLVRSQKQATESIIKSRLLVLQSKRLMLNSLQRRLEEQGYDSLKERITRLTGEAETAQYSYRSSMLAWGSPDSVDYWLVAYSRLIEVGNVVVDKLRDSTGDLPPAERYQVSADVEMLEHMLGKWGATMRESMAKAVA